MKCPLKAAAKEQGKVHYLGFLPCGICGGFERYTVNGRCVECLRRKNEVRYPTKGVLSASKSHIKRTYGLTQQAYEALLTSQNFSCAICDARVTSMLDATRPLRKGPSGPREGVAAIDHDHATGKVRGLLCFSCNVGLGKFRDNKQFLLNAARYLGESPTVPSVNRSLRESEGERGPVYQERDPDQAISRVIRQEELSLLSTQ